MIWQTQVWQDMLKKSGQVEKTIILEENGQKIFIEKRKITLDYGLFIIGFTGKITESLVTKLKQICREENCLFFQIETISYFGDTTNYDFLHKSIYKKFITPYTAVIDLSDSEEIILKNMKSKGRYNIRLAAKKGVEVYPVETTDENIKIFYELMQETTSRDNFAGNTFSYYKHFLETIPESELLFANFGGKIIAAGIFIFSEEVALYYYGASSGDKQYRKYMAPYALQWQAIEIAKEKNCKLYDFLGVADPDIPNDPLQGVTDFKKKFTADIRRVSEGYMWVQKKWKYRLVQMLRKLKNS